MSNTFTIFPYIFQGTGDRPFTSAKHARKKKPDQELLKTEETEGPLQETHYTRTGNPTEIIEKPITPN